MNEITLIGISVFLLIFGGILGFLLAGFRSKSSLSILRERNDQLQLQFEGYKAQVLEAKKATDRQYADVCNERETIREEKDVYRNQLTQRNSELENLRERLEEQKAEVEKLKEKFTKEFENLANKILDQKSEKFTSLNKENIQNILSPLQEKIKTFEEKVEKNSNDFIERHGQLGKQLQLLNEQNI